MQTTKHHVRPFLTIGAAGAVTAAAVNSAIYAVGRVAGVDFLVESGTTSERIQAGHVLTLSLISFAVGLLAVAIAAWRRPRWRLFQVFGAIIAVGSIVMDVTIDASAATKLVLASMHLVVGAVYWVTLNVVHQGDTVSPPASRRSPLAPAAH